MLLNVISGWTGTSVIGGDAPEWACKAWEANVAIQDRYPDMIEDHYKGILYLDHCDIPEGHLPTFVMVGFDLYEYDCKIRDKCKKRGINWRG